MAKTVVTIAPKTYFSPFFHSPVFADIFLYQALIYNIIAGYLAKCIKYYKHPPSKN